MLKEIKKFYEKTKNKRVTEDDENPISITWIHVFHKEYPRFPSIELPIKKNEESQLEMLFEMRKSTRVFSNKPITLEELSQILRSCRIVGYVDGQERRTYPSGGARFPVELYLISFNVEGLNPGAYHYNLRRNTLELLWQKDLKNKQRELISPYLDNPAATIIFTSVIARAEVKYGLRAYPYSLIEAGHMGQNIHLKCAELGIGSCSVSGFVDDTVKKILDLTDDEIPIYSISIGWEKKYGR
jgi:SagB-type dehydrogenase family enzyme